MITNVTTDYVTVHIEEVDMPTGTLQRSGAKQDKAHVHASP